MAELDAENFGDYFFELWKVQPFAWQVELARRVLEDEKPWPEAIALPTAAGKTACLDIAVYALASQAKRLFSGIPLTAPRRIFFVVDRRVIVDEAFERASLLSEKLKSATNGILKDVSDGLRLLSGGQDPLVCCQMRGGMYRSDAWAKSPIQPTIIASTVDQIGSRLLFRTYGRSFKAWPIQAGLTGNDSLIFLDEAHCSQPFLETLQAVAKYRKWAETPLFSPFHAVVMSATPPGGVSDIFHDESDEPKNRLHPLGKRQLASKPAKLVLTKAKGKSANKEMAKEMVLHAEDMLKIWKEQFDKKNNQSEQFSAHPAVEPATVIFCNRVDTAREAHRILFQKYGDQSILMTGRMRPVDKDDLISGPISLLGADKSVDRRLLSPLFVIATQTLEVGANLDFDMLVTECASLDALRQRFGRLNRMGRTIESTAVILIRSDQAENSNEDPVYGSALAETWKWLNEQADLKKEIDMGIAAISRVLPAIDELMKFNAQTTHAPVMLPAHIDILAQTAPEPWPTPEISLFLHGSKSGPADVLICWRSDLIESEENNWKDAIIICPPASPECLSIPFMLMRRWLSGETVDSSTDIEGVVDKDKQETENIYSRKVIRWRGRDDVEVTDDPLSIRPGDVVIIPASLAGWNILATLGDNPIPDWGDRSFIKARDKAILRLHPEILKQWQYRSLDQLKEIAGRETAKLEDDPDALREEIIGALNGVIDDPELSQALPWLNVCVKGLAHDFIMISHPTGGLVLRGKYRLNQYESEADVFCDEDDPTASGSLSVRLISHLAGVADLAARFAGGCGLPAQIVETIKTAGCCHDYGKADPRFQAWLKGGNPWLCGPLLAKSEIMPLGRKESEAARKRSGYPAGGRHELLSVRLMQNKPDFLPAAEELNELLLHLVASHHGYCRPFAPVVEDTAPVDVELDIHGNKLKANSETYLEMLDSGVAERFWRLIRRYGWWGLAWLETIVRLADHRWSEAEERELNRGKQR